MENNPAPRSDSADVADTGTVLAEGSSVSEPTTASDTPVAEGEAAARRVKGASEPEAENEAVSRREKKVLDFWGMRSFVAFAHAGTECVTLSPEISYFFSCVHFSVQMDVCILRGGN